MNSQKIEVELKSFLAARFPGLAGEVDANTAIAENDEIDSLGVLEVVTFLYEEFDIEIDDDDFEPENFATVGALLALVTKKLDVS